MPEINLSASFQKNERIASLASHLIAAVMLACVVVSIVQLGEFLRPEWQGDYLTIVCFVLALESMYSYRKLHGTNLFDRERLAYRVAEWVAILVGLRLLIYVRNDIRQLVIDLPRMEENFIATVLAGEYLFAVIVVLVIWVLAASIAEKLHVLEGDEHLLNLEQDAGYMVERAAVRAGLANMILFLGGVMVFLAAMIRLDLKALTGRDFPATGSVANLLLFFVLGLVLLSLTQFSLLRARWSLQRVPVSANLSGNWILYSLGFLLALSVLAILLPTGYSVGLLEALGYLINLLVSVFSLLLFLLLIPFMLLISLLASLFGSAMSYDPPPLMELAEPPVNPGASLPEMIRSILFWTVFLAVIGFSLVYFLRQNQALSGRLRQFPLFVVLGQAWRWLRQWLGRVNRVVSNALETGRKRLQMRLAARGAGAAWDYLNLRRLSPRQRIVFYYLAMLRRGSERGITRRPGETPFEYAQELERRLPDVDEDVEQLTRQFVEARFSRHAVGDDQSNLVQQLWQRIRKALRRLQT